MNNTMLIGRLTKDPETRQAGETQVTTFTLAVDRFGKEKTADFIRIVAFGKTAELCERYLAKGRLTAVQGRIQTGSYEKDGHKVYTTDVIADRVKFLEWGEKPDIPEGFTAIEDDDIPF
jgi:single-strand DNA-binding protein